MGNIFKLIDLSNVFESDQNVKNLIFYKINQESRFKVIMKEQQQDPSLKRETQVPVALQKNQTFQQQPYEFVGLKLSAAFLTVLASEYLVSNTIIYRIISKLTAKNLKDEAQRKAWINQQLNRLTRTMVRYNTVIFGSKVLLDEYYSQTLKRNEIYYQSNSPIYYKIGAIIGLIAYFWNVPVSQLQIIRSNNKNFLNNSGIAHGKMERYAQIWKQFFSVDSFKRMMHNLSFTSLAGVVLFRTIYFGGYQKLRHKYNNPVNQYILAPICCSTLSLAVSPLDQVKYLQMTSHKDKSFFQIVNEKGGKLWHISAQKLVSSVLKQTISLSFFVVGQNLCKYLIKNIKTKNQY